MNSPNKEGEELRREWEEYWYHMNTGGRFLSHEAIYNWFFSKLSQHDERVKDLILNIKPASQPLEPYLSIVKTGNMDAMFDWAYQKALADVLALFEK